MQHDNSNAGCFLSNECCTLQKNKMKREEKYTATPCTRVKG